MPYYVSQYFKFYLLRMTEPGEIRLEHIVLVILSFRVHEEETHSFSGTEYEMPEACKGQ